MFRKHFNLKHLHHLQPKQLRCPLDNFSCKYSKQVLERIRFTEFCDHPREQRSFPFQNSYSCAFMEKTEWILINRVCVNRGKVVSSFGSRFTQGAALE